MPRLDRNAGDQLRFRRNAQRTNDGSMLHAIPVTAPLSIDSGSLAVTLATAGGIQNASGLAIKLADTSLALSVPGLAVKLANNSGLTISSGVTIVLDAVTTTTSGLALGANGIRVRGFATNASAPSLSNGDVYYDTAKGWAVLQETGVPSVLSGRVYVTTANSATVSNTITETDVESGFTFPANFFTVGRVVRITLVGEFSTKVAPAGSFSPRLILKDGSGTRVQVSNPSFAPAGSDTNARWSTQFTLIGSTTGATGTLGRIGFLAIEDQSNTLAAGLILPGAGGTTMTIDTTKTQTVVVSIQFATANAANSAFLHRLIVEVL